MFCSSVYTKTLLLFPHALHFAIGSAVQTEAEHCSCTDWDVQCMLESSHTNTCILEYVLADSKVLLILNTRNVRKPANQPHNKAPLLLVQ